MSLPTIGAGLLVIGGLVNTFPPISEQLSKISGGKPIVQILLGVASTIIGLVLVTNIL